MFSAGIGAAPSAFFQGADVLLGPGGGQLIGREPVDVSLMAPLASVATVRAVSPEIYLPTSIAGRSAFVRGVDFPAFFQVDPAQLVEGSVPTDARGALAGAGFVRTFDVRIGDTITVPAGFAEVAIPLTITGIVEGRSPARDELLVPLAAARELTHLSPTQVHLARVRADDPSLVSSTIHSIAPNFTVSDVRLSDEDIVPGERVLVRANLTNWGRAEGTRTLTVRANGAPVGTASFTVPSRATVSIEIPAELPSVGLVNLSVNPTIQVSVRAPGLRVVDIPLVEEGDDVPMRVVDADHAPQPGIVVQVGEESATTDADGRATLRNLTAGGHRAIALRDGNVEVVQSFFVAARGHRDSPLLSPRSLSAEGGLVGSSGSFGVTLAIENAGGGTGRASIPLLLDGEEVERFEAVVQPGQVVPVTVRIGPLSPGTYLLATDDATGPNATVRVIAGDPRVEALLRLYESTPGAAPDDPAARGSGEEYITEILGNVGAAVTVIAVSGSALAALGAVAVMQRHIATRARSVGILKALGATDDRVRNLAAREAALAAFVAVPIGIFAGGVISEIIARVGIVRAFGHEVSPTIPWGGIGALALLSIFFVALVARQLVGGMLRAPADALLRDEPLRGERPPPPRLDDVLDPRHGGPT